jgi:hypothetical protein
MVDLANTIFRDFETDGVPSSGKHKPRKAKIREWGAWLEGFVQAFTSNGGLIYQTKAQLDADLAHGANSSAWVVADSTAANNGIYRKTGASGTGSWTRVADLPYSFIRLTDAGAGTANAIVATSNIPLPSSPSAALLVMNVFEANTGNVTVAVNGAAAKPLLTSSGNQINAGGIKAGMFIAFLDTGSSFRLLSEQAGDSFIPQMEALIEEAEAAAADALAAAAGVDLPPVTPDSMLVDNAAGTARESKTFAQVRTALQVIPVDKLPYISGYWNGVVSTNTAAQNAAAIQAILNNSAYSQGGKIDIQRLVNFNQQIDLTGKFNFCFFGQTQINSGARTPSALLWTGTGSAPAIKNAGAGNGFDHCDLYCSNSAFTGFLVDCTGSGNTYFNDMLFKMPATSGPIGIILNNTIATCFKRVNFIGYGDFVFGRSGSSSNYANEVRFTECQFHNDGGFAIQAPHGGWHFEGGYAQAAASDGGGRFINGSSTLPFQTLTIKNMLLSDANKSGAWLTNLYGTQLEVSHCIGASGGADGYGVLADMRGVIGAKIHQNDWRPVTNSRLVEMPNTGTTKFIKIEDNLVNAGFLVTPGTSLATQSVVLGGNYTSAGVAVTA